MPDDATPQDTGAEPPPVQPAATGRDRLLASLRRPGSRGQVTVGLLMVVLGFAAVVQVRSNSTDAEYVGARQDELISLINSLSLASQRAENEIAQLEQTRSSLLNDTQARRTALERARQRVDELGILAGTVPAVGSGVQVDVRDPDGAVGANNLVNGIQELRDAGAEAIELNNTVRVVAQTSLRDVPDGGVVVDGEVITAPYTIEAIGGPHNLASALDLRRGFTYEVERVGGTVGVVRSETVEINSIHEVPQTQYADPVPTE
ncbi:MAG: DUF881 domain-containing protein [Nocardioides sp.]